MIHFFHAEKSSDDLWEEINYIRGLKHYVFLNATELEVFMREISDLNYASIKNITALILYELISLPDTEELFTKCVAQMLDRYLNDEGMRHYVFRFNANRLPEDRHVFDFFDRLTSALPLFYHRMFKKNVETLKAIDDQRFGEYDFLWLGKVSSRYVFLPFVKPSSI